MATDFPTGNGAAWLDFLATLRGRYREARYDTIKSTASLSRWLATTDMAPRTPVTEADVAAAGELREALHAMTVAALNARAPQPSDTAIVNRALRADSPVQCRVSSGALSLERPATIAAALGRLARDAVQVLAGPERAALHPCGDATCSGVFLDRTGRRRWCSSELCGNRMRVQAHRARTRDSHSRGNATR